MTKPVAVNRAGATVQPVIIIVLKVFCPPAQIRRQENYRLDMQNYDCNGNLLCDNGVVVRNRISSLQSHGKALEKECCFPGVFSDSGDTPANLLGELNGHLMPCTSCLYGKCVEDVCAGQFGVFVYLVPCCLLGCCTWFSCCAANVRLSIMCLVLSRPRPLAFLWPMAREWTHLGVCCHPASG